MSARPDTAETCDVTLEPADQERLANLCGPLDQHLRQLEERFDVSIANRGNQFRIHGDPQNAQTVADVLIRLYASTLERALSPELVHLELQESGLESRHDDADSKASLRVRRGYIHGRGANQCRYIRAIQTHDINFGIGPAGTGKTFLAVAAAVEGLESERIRRLVLVRPAVEAGERLGFLPGDLAQKVDPYLRPLYDALYEMLGFERVGKLIERNVIEVAPLAYMRGRTLNESFIILDEAQNTSVEQMKMFLTRIGFGSTAVITGDITQIDLPRGQFSGLRHVARVLADVPGLSFTWFESKDVVRHPLVKRILDAYAAAEDASDE